MSGESLHKWAHTAAPPLIVCALQNTRAVLSPEEHSQSARSRVLCDERLDKPPILDAAIRCVRSRDRRKS